MTKRIIVLVVLLFCLVNCSNVIKVNKYDELTPYIEVEKTTLKEFKEIEIEEYIFKFENKESFICFFYSLDCSYCHKLINNIINPYIQESKNIIYGLNVYKENNYKKIDQIQKYQPIANNYFSAKNSTVLISRPVIQIINDGIVIDYEVGYSINCKNLIEAYIIKEKK